MESKALEKALNWILLENNADVFKKDFNAVLKHVGDLSAGDITTLKMIHEKGMPEVEKLIDSDVGGQRSYGWPEK